MRTHLHAQATVKSPPSVLELRPLVDGERDPGRDCLSSLGTENTHTHTCTHTRVHHVNATMGYSDNSADCAHREAAAEWKGCTQGREDCEPGVDWGYKR